MPRTKSKPQQKQQTSLVNGPASEVMTLGEASAYLRLPEAEVLRALREQHLPARQVGQEWRFLKRAVQGWLSQPQAPANSEGIWAFAGAWKDDPHAEEML